MPDAAAFAQQLKAWQAQHAKKEPIPNKVRRKFAEVTGIMASKYNIRGVDVHFPYDAYQNQLIYMERVIESLQKVLVVWCWRYFERASTHSSKVQPVLVKPCACCVLHWLGGVRKNHFFFMFQTRICCRPSNDSICIQDTLATFSSCERAQKYSLQA